jgi:hypothetical protein
VGRGPPFYELFFVKAVLADGWFSLISDLRLRGLV